MSNIIDSHKVVNSSTAAKKYHSNNDLVVSSSIPISKGKELLSFHKKIDNNNNNRLNISISIASAITSYARIYMNKFKYSLKDNLYYSDTDSLFLDIKLDPCHISDTIIGKFKLEKIFDKALFLSPKMYSGKSKLSNGIIEQYTKIKGVKINVKFI